MSIVSTRPDEQMPVQSQRGTRVRTAQAHQEILLDGACSSRFVTQFLRSMAFPGAHFLPSAVYSLDQDAKVTRDVVKTPCRVCAKGQREISQLCGRGATNLSCSLLLRQCSKSCSECEGPSYWNDGSAWLRLLCVSLLGKLRGDYKQFPGPCLLLSWRVPQNTLHA